MKNKNATSMCRYTDITFYVSLGAGNLKNTRTTSELEKFKSSCADMIPIMIKQTDTKSRIRLYLCKI